jgi:hypothetical protein
MSDEVLVHISTAATRHNDELFRALASAYIDFEPHQIHREGPVRKRARVDQTIPRLPNQCSARAKTETQDTAIQFAPTASKESYGSFPSNIPADGHYLEEDESLRPISRLAQLDRSYLSWRKRTTPKSSFAQSEAEERISSDRLDADTGFIEDSQSALQALQSQLQDTYSATSADTSEDEDGEAYVGEHDDLARNHRPFFPSVSPIRSQESAKLERRPLSGLSKDSALLDLDVNMPHEPTGLPYAANTASSDRSEDFPDATNFSELPIDAFPPAPITSVACPGALPSQVTKHLAAIKAKNPTRVRPLKVRRDLEHDERGFWRIDCTRWSSNAQRDFWLSLCEHVGSGRVGWATTLHREAGMHKDLGLVRIYCWGEVVEHMWLLLWLCSKGKASGLDFKWIDASGIAVIETT